MLSGRANGLYPRTITYYKWRLGLFAGYPLTPEGIKSFLDSLTCGNEKWNYFKSLCATVNWLYRSGYLTTNPIELVESPRRQSKILPAISKEQFDTLSAHCHSGREKAILNLLSYSGMRLSEVGSVKAQDFNWEEGTVIVLGKGNRYGKALAENGIVREWFSEHNSFELDASGIQVMLKRSGRISGIHCNPDSLRRGMAVHNVKSGLSTRVVQALGGWETIAVVEGYSKSLTFDNALQLYRQVNGSEVWG